MQLKWFSACVIRLMRGSCADQRLDAQIIVEQQCQWRAYQLVALLSKINIHRPLSHQTYASSYCLDAWLSSDCECQMSALEAYPIFLNEKLQSDGALSAYMKPEQMSLNPRRPSPRQFNFLFARFSSRRSTCNFAHAIIIIRVSLEWIF